MNWFRPQVYQLSSFRINALFLGIFFLLALILARIFYLQIVRHDYYLNLGLNQRSIVRDVQAERGRIFALASPANPEDLYPLAINKVYYEVSVDPSKITRPQNVTDIFAQVLELDEAGQQEVLDKIKKEDRFYELIVKELPQDKVDELSRLFEELRFDINKTKNKKEQIKDLSELGVNFVKHILRLYPDKEVGAHILGFLGYGDDGIKRAGKYGLESYFENDLAGFGGRVIGEKDQAGRLLNKNDGIAAENGADLILTLDRNIQYSACKSLEKAVAQYNAQSGTVIIMETKTGAIRAMCNYPSFDPNEYNKVTDANVYNNSAVYEAYEPGSVMKVIAMSIAIDQDKVTPDTLYEDKGEVKFAGGQVVRNSDLKAHGMVDMKEVLSSSLNTGIIFATSEINNKIFEEYMKNFGFGQETEIMTEQEAQGNISSLAKKGDIYKATASYGQGITVTPLQMVSAVNAIANQGELLQPYIVKEIRYINGDKKEFSPNIIRRVIDKSTAVQVSAMMVHTVDVGHSKKAGVEGYYVAAKTGTANVSNPNGGYYGAGKTIHTVVGFAPNEDPKFTMITKLNYPTAAFAESTAAPLFGEIAKFLLEYYQIAPSR
ncbi:MAG: penicillin-binding protein 2 [bacterium]|nr:penicillin-binding protein 2 [bacterium]